MTLKKSITEKVFDSIDITIFKYIREYTKTFVCEPLFREVTDATYDRVDDTPRHAVCLATDIKIRCLYDYRFT
jgi:hypothetical protein